MAFRFIHSADLHLDSPLRSLALRDAALADSVDTATRQALMRMVDLCLVERVNALVLAGDLYDGSQTSMKTARFLGDQISRLDEAGIRVFIIRGNHDALSKISHELVFPESVKIYTGHAEAVLVQPEASDPPVYIHGLSFAQAHVTESLLRKYKPAVSGAVNIGILHTSLGGAPGHDLYSPCSLAELGETGFHYWALGHIHKRSVNRLPNGCTIVMPGMPQGRDIGEAGAKSVTLVTIRDNGAVETEERVVGPARFEKLTINVADSLTWEDLVRHLRRTLTKARDDIKAEQLIARVRLTGQTPLAWRIRRDQDLLKTELAMATEMAGACGVEQLEIACQPPEALRPMADNPLMELRRLIDQQIIAEPGFQSEMMMIAEELIKQLPQECRKTLGNDEQARRAILDQLAKEGADDVLARFYASAEAEAYA